MEKKMVASLDDGCFFFFFMHTEGTVEKEWRLREDVNGTTSLWPELKPDTLFFTDFPILDHKTALKTFPAFVWKDISLFRLVLDIFYCS